MNANDHLTPKQDMQAVLAFANIENDEPVCQTIRYDEGLYYLVLRTLCLRYEFYVDAANGEVLGISTEPLPYMESINMCGGEDSFPSLA